MVRIFLFEFIQFLLNLGLNFSVDNYINEHEFGFWIKSGGYGKVYMGNIKIIFLFFISEFKKY